MVEAEIRMPDGANLRAAEQLVERSCKAEGLQLTRRGTLARYPGCIHWHFSRHGERGILEITLHPSSRRLWLSVKSDRTGAWTADTMIRLQENLNQALHAHDTPPASKWAGARHG